MNKRLQSMTDKRAELLERQHMAMQDIMSMTVDSQKAAGLLNVIVSTAGEHRELLRAIDAEIERSRRGWWSRILHAV